MVSTEVTLRDHLDRYIEDHSNLHDLEHLAVKEAMDAAERRAGVALAGVERTNTVHRDAHLAVHMTQKENIDKADISMDKRLHTMNEWREAQRHLITTMLPRAEGEARLAALSEKLERANQAYGRMISRDVFEAAQDALIKRMDAASAERSKLSEEVSNSRARAAAYSFALGTLFAILTLLLGAFTALHK